MLGMLVATPCYGGACTEAYLRSSLALSQVLTQAQIPFDWFTLANESLVTRARNVCAATFLEETEYSHLLFIDADIEYCPGDVTLLWNMEADVAVGPYRVKKEGSVLAAWKDGQLTEIGGESEPFEVEYAGTGFMLIKREVFEKLKEKVYDYEEGQIGRCWSFFDTSIEGDLESKDWKDRFHLPEDFNFCKLARQSGFKIMMHPEIKLKHHGQKAY